MLRFSINYATFLYLSVPVGKPTLMTIPRGDAITENEYVEFLCFVTEGTPPISFKWYQGENRRPVHTITVMKNHSTYNVPMVKSVHSGRYYCEAINGAGIEKASKDITVTGQTIKISDNIYLAQH